LLPIRRRASQHPRRANRSPRGTRPSCKLTARPCAASQKAATTPLTNHKKNPQPRFNRNQQYSITAVSDGGGSVVERYAYSAYGQVTIADGSGSQISNSSISNRYTYTGREWDEGLSLYHYRARMYDAVGGRFVSRDPIGFKGSPWGLYEYVKGKPFVSIDPTGEHPPLVVLGIIGCVSSCFNCYDCVNAPPGQCGVVCKFVGGMSCISCGGCILAGCALAPYVCAGVAFFGIILF
jgi:RHS repeat-associated protein